MFVSRSMLRNLILEALLLEGISKNELIKKYRYLDKYTTYLDKLNPKYYNSLDTLIKEFLDDNDASISHGVIIFMFMMHQKYSSTNLLSKEYKDFTRLSLDSLQKAIESLGAQYTDAPLYGELVELDKELSKQMIDDDKSEAANVASKAPSASSEVRPGLFHLKTVSGWQILKPATVAGSQAIGVKSWCTVYSDAFSSYSLNGIVLYYCVKDGKNYKENGYGFDYQINPYDYISIGFHNGKIYIPSPSYESSVWGNQKGVTYQNLEKRMGVSASKSVINAIKKHFMINHDTAIDGGNQKEFLERKYKQTLATNVRVLKKEARNLGPDQTLEMITQAIQHPMLSDLVLDFIFEKYYKKIDSKMRKTSVFTNEGETGYLAILRSQIWFVHKQFSKDQASMLMDGLLNDLNTFTRYTWDNPIFKSSLWESDLGESGFERILNMIKVSEFENYSSEKANAKHKGIDEFPFTAFKVMFQKKNKHAAAVFFKKYNLGTYDTFLFNFVNKAKSQSSGNQTNLMSPSSGSYSGSFWAIFHDAKLSNLMPQHVVIDLIKLKIRNAETMSYDDLHYSTSPYKVFYTNISEEKKQKMGIQNVSEECKIAAEACDRYLNLWSGDNFFRSMSRQEKTQITELKNVILNKMKDFITNHNKVFREFPNSIKMNSDIYHPIINAILSLPPELSMKTLETIEGLNDSNDFYFVNNFIDAAKNLERGDEYCVELFDWAQQRLAKKKDAQGENTNDVFKRMSRMIYGGYDGMRSKSQVRTSYRLYKNNPHIFFKCLEYALLYLDYSDTRHPKEELSKMFAYLVRDNILTYDQAVKEVKECNLKIAELAKILQDKGKITDNQARSLTPHINSAGIERGGYIFNNYLDNHNPAPVEEDSEEEEY